MSIKRYIDKDDIMLGTMVEWQRGQYRIESGEVIDYLVTGVRLYYIVQPDDVYQNLALVKADDVRPYIWI